MVSGGALSQFVNIEAEQQLLGAMLIDNSVFDRVGALLKPEVFADPVHGRVFEAISAKVRDGNIASPVTLKLAMEGDAGLKELGGPAYLARLAGTAISSHAAKDYAEIIVDAAALRAIDDMMVGVRNKMLSGMSGRDAALAIMGAIQALPEARGGESRHSFIRAASDALTSAVEAYQGGGSYLSTGVAPVDRIIRGLGPGNYCLIGGAPSMGKTSLAVEIAANVASRPDMGVIFASLEMTKEELANRFISRDCRIPYDDIRSAADMSEDDFRKWVEASNRVGRSFAMEVIPRHVRSISALRSAVRRASLQLPGGKPALVVVDYAQLIEPDPGRKYSGRYEFMTDASVRLKDMAATFEVPVIALVQLNRDIGNRSDRRPQLTDIRESGQFEQDADQVIMCHRESYWLERLGPKPDKNGKITPESRAEWGSEIERWTGRMELFVRKNRHGRIGAAEVGFHEPTNRFWRIGGEAEGFL